MGMKNQHYDKDVCNLDIGTCEEATLHGKGERSTADGKQVDYPQCWGKNEACKIDQEKKVKEIRGPRMFLHSARKRLEVGDTLLSLLQIGKGMDILQNLSEEMQPKDSLV